jgi:hypothetical protein
MAHIERMIANALKLAGVAALIMASVGIWPNRRYGAVISIGVCVMGAVALHFAAP